MTGGCAIGGIRRGLSARGLSEVGIRMCSALPTGDNPASSGGAVDKGDVEVRAADLLGFFELDPRIRVRGGEVWIECEYLATNNKYMIQEKIAKHDEGSSSIIM